MALVLSNLVATTSADRTMVQEIALENVALTSQLGTVTNSSNKSLPQLVLIILTKLPHFVPPPAGVTTSDFPSHHNFLQGCICCCNNTKYCWMYGWDILDWHTSSTCCFIKNKIAPPPPKMQPMLT